MIDFEKELEKFEPALELEDVEDSIKSKDLTDMTDILVKMTASGNAPSLDKK